jgi:hypothetical protein
MPKRVSEENIKMDLQKVRCQLAYWIRVSRGKDQ